MTNSLGEATEEEKNSSEHRYKEEIKNNSNIQNATRHRIHADFPRCTGRTTGQEVSNGSREKLHKNCTKSCRFCLI